MDELPPSRAGKGSMFGVQPSLGDADNFWHNTAPPTLSDDPKLFLSHQKQASQQSGSFPLSSSTLLSLEAVPEWVEKSTSFFTRTAPAQVMAFLEPILTSNNLDCDHVDRSRAQLQGMARDFSVMIQIYSSAHGESVVEFQRRSGDCMSFSAFYRKTLSMLGPVVLRTFSGAKVPVARPVLQAIDLTALTTGLPTDSKQTAQQQQLAKLRATQSAALSNSLCQMAQSKYTDVSREGYRALASVAARTSQPLLHDTSMVADTFSSLFHATSDAETLRQGSSALADLCCAQGGKPFGARLAQQNEFMNGVFNALDGPRSLAHRSTKRHLVRAVASMCEDEHTARGLLALPASDTHRAILHKFTNNTDLALRDSAVSAINRLQAVC